MQFLEKLPKIIKTGILIIFFLVVAATAKVIIKEFIQSNSKSNSPVINQEFMNKLVAGVNNDLPKLMDSNTRLDYVDSLNNSFTYHYTLLSASSLNDISYLRTALPPEIKPKAVQYFCGKKIMRQVLDAGIHIIYSYNTPAGRPIVAVTITKEDCRL